MAFRLAKSLVTLRDQVNAAAPNRSTASDGWIGDIRHRRRKSDHNPNSAGVVTALDITHDPIHGVDGTELAESAKLDPRVKYVIWNKRIWTPSVAKAWRNYTGTNPHTKHVHISMLPAKAKYDDAAQWVMKGVEAAGEAAADLPPAPEPPKLQLGSQGLWVRKLQTMLNKGVKVDGDFGPKTKKAVEDFQKANGLTVDGIVGPYTWEALEKQANPVILNKTTGEPALPPPAPPVAVPPPGEPPAPPEAAPEAPAAPETPTGSPRWAVEYLKELGWPKVVAIALVANVIWESGGAKRGVIDWSAHGDKGADGQYHSHTALQLNDKHGRWQAFEQFAADRGSAWDDPDAALRWLDKELHTTERNVGNGLKTAETLAQAMKIAINYWRPGKPYAERRAAIAEKLEKELA